MERILRAFAKFYELLLKLSEYPLDKTDYYWVNSILTCIHYKLPITVDLEHAFFLEKKYSVHQRMMGYGLAYDTLFTDRELKELLTSTNK